VREEDGNFFPPISGLVENSIEVWRSTGSDFPSLGRRYSRNEQRVREDLLDRCTDRVDRELRNPSITSADAEETLALVISGVVEVANLALDLDDPYVDTLLRDGFSQVGIELARRARKLDPRVKATDILQACRNAWTACGLQLLLGRTMRLTPAIFAYSMLYPYSDNYLDDAAIPHAAKLRFSTRFRDRLAGGHLAAADGREAIIWELVGLIEAQYPRPNYPQIYNALLAIHRAQQESIRQIQISRDGGDPDVLALSVGKGGMSVLADAYLAAGTLNKSEARFAFEWGVLLQISDDLQDVRQDLRSRSRTLFSQAARREPLDALTNRTLHLSQVVMSRMTALPNRSEILRQLLARSSRSLLIRSAANAPELYTSCYLERLEAHSPLSFAFLRSRERRFARRSRSYAGLLELLADETRRSSASPRAIQQLDNKLRGEGQVAMLNHGCAGDVGSPDSF
jgi:hypothetical protein